MDLRFVKGDAVKISAVQEEPMSFPLEAWFGIASAVLLIVLAYAAYQTSTRDRAHDPIGDATTRELYEHPDTYPERRRELQKQFEP
jgi:hypothetical protein